MDKFHEWNLVAHKIAKSWVLQSGIRARPREPLGAGEVTITYKQAD